MHISQIQYYTVNDSMRMILNLPARMGGMGFLEPSKEADLEYRNSICATKQLTDAIYHQQESFGADKEVQEQAMKELKKMKEDRWKQFVKRTSNNHQTM